jgi:radical SAM superfamily enzyme YgiQ (UPF0313 family)
VFYIDDLVPLVDAVRRRTDAPIVLGGASLTVMPEEILRAVRADCAVLGDGEATFPRLLERMERQEAWEDLPGIAFLRGGTFIANPSPQGVTNECAAPAYHRWVDLNAYRLHLSTVPVQTKIGCRFQCVHCTYRKIEGNAYRFSDPESVANAVARLAASGHRDIEFVDSVFNDPQDHAVSVCEELIRSGVRARFQSLELNPLHFDDELLTVMERAGFVGIGLTVESASDPVLRGLRKGFTTREIHGAAGTVRRHRLPCVWIFMLGGPGETRETVRETLRFAEKNIRPRDVAFFTSGSASIPGRSSNPSQDNRACSPSPARHACPGVLRIARRRRRMDQGAGKNSTNSHMNFMSGDSFSFPYLPLIHRMGYRLGLRSPLWRYTRYIRRGLRFAGMDV